MQLAPGPVWVGRTMGVGPGSWVKNTVQCNSAIVHRHNSQSSKMSYHCASLESRMAYFQAENLHTTCFLLSSGQFFARGICIHFTSAHYTQVSFWCCYPTFRFNEKLQINLEIVLLKFYGLAPSGEPIPGQNNKHHSSTGFLVAYGIHTAGAGVRGLHGLRNSISAVCKQKWKQNSGKWNSV